MNAGGSGLFAGTRLRDYEYRDIVLGKLTDNSFHCPHAGTDAFPPHTACAVGGGCGTRQYFGAVDIHAYTVLRAGGQHLERSHVTQCTPAAIRSLCECVRKECLVPY